MNALVFSGASSKLPIHVGFYQSVMNHQLEFDQVHGTSAGSMVASMIASGLSLSEIKDVVLEIDFAKVANLGFFGSVWDFFTKSGLSSGRSLERAMKTIYGDITFNDLVYDLHVYAHSLGSGSWVVFNKKNTPDFPVSKAVRMSATIPFVFRPVRYDSPNIKIHGERVIKTSDWGVDGGLSKCFPIDEVKDRRSIGHLVSNAKQETKWESIKMMGMCQEFVRQMLSVNELESVRDAPKNSVIVRSDYDLGMFDFSVSKEQKLEMIKLGYYNTEAELGRHGII